MPVIHAFLSEDHAFLKKHAAKIAGVVSCFDRLIFRGYLPISSPGGVCGWLYRQGVGASAFNTFCAAVAGAAVATRQADGAGRGPAVPIAGDAVQGRAGPADRRGRRHQSGPGVRLRPRAPQLTGDLRRCTVLYYFWMDAEQAFCMILDA
jgi:hypothetical protein